MAAENVVYRGEGIQNLVLANCEDKKVYRLLKIVNQKKNECTKHGTSEEERSKQIHHSLENIVDYVQNVMEPLLSPHFVCVPKLTKIPKGFVEKIEAEIQHVRPARRVNRNNFQTVDPATCSALVLPDLCFLRDGDNSELDTDTNSHSRRVNRNNFQTVDPATCSALVLPDLCFLRDGDNSELDTDKHHTISVEIKPKKGFLPSFTKLPKESAVKSSVCKFCLHKCLKEKSGRWTEWSQYCPLDLFSGDRRRMKHALLSQYTTPQNNFKIFKNGKEVYSELVQGDLSAILSCFFDNTVNGLKNGLRKQQELHAFIELIIDALLATPVKGDNSRHQPENKSSHKSKPDKCSCQSASDKQNSVKRNETVCLSRSISQEQHCDRSSYDKTLIEGQEDKKKLPAGCVLERILYTQEFDTDDVEGVWPLYQSIKEHLRLHPEDNNKLCMYGPFTQDSWLLPCLQQSDSEDTESLDYAVYMVKRFLVSRTMQDCSIMLAFQKLPDDSSEYDNDWRCMTDCYDQKFLCSINIIDLDPKPFDKLQKYEKLEQNILEAYKELWR